MNDENSKGPAAEGASDASDDSRPPAAASPLAGEGAPAAAGADDGVKSPQSPGPVVDSDQDSEVRPEPDPEFGETDTEPDDDEPGSKIEVSNPGARIGTQVIFGTGELAIPLDKEPFKDPTLPLPATSGSSRYRFDDGDLGKWGHLLERNRVIALRSPDDGVTSAAAHSLLALDRLERYEKRLLAFGPKNQKRDDIFLESLIVSVGGDERPIALLVEAPGSLPLIESTLLGEAWAEAIKEALRSEDFLVVLQISARHWQQIGDRFGTFHFPCWQIDFLRPLLAANRPHGQVDRLHRELEEQRAAGLWGLADDDVYFFDAVQPLIADSAGRLEAEIRRRALEARVEDEASAVDAFADGNRVERGLLFTATFFRGLDVTEFGALCLAVCGDETLAVDEVKITKKGKQKKRKRERALREVWSTVADDLLARCHLVVRASENQAVVAFREPGDRAKLATRIKEGAPVFFSETSRRLWREGMLFEPSISPQLVDGISTLIAEALTHNSLWQRSDWVSITLAERLTSVPSENLLDRLHNAVVDSFVLSRLGALLRVLVGRDQQRELVDTWLRDLLSRRGHLQALALANHLRFAEGFDYLFWLKRLSDEGTDSIRHAAYSALYRHARRSPVRIWDFLGRLEGWLPEDDRTAKAMSESNGFALQLVLEYAVDSAESLKDEDFGRWPPRYPLFRDFARDSGLIHERFSALVGWLFHPGSAAIYRQSDAGVISAVRARLIEMWSYVLLGIGAKEAAPEAVRVHELMLTLCRERTDRSEAARLVATWRNDRTRYLEHRRRADREQARYLDRRRWHSRRLESEFKSTRPVRAGGETR